MAALRQRALMQQIIANGAVAQSYCALHDKQYNPTQAPAYGYRQYTYNYKIYNSLKRFAMFQSHNIKEPVYM